MQMQGPVGGRVRIGGGVAGGEVERDGKREIGDHENRQWIQIQYIIIV